MATTRWKKLYGVDLNIRQKPYRMEYKTVLFRTEEEAEYAAKMYHKLSRAVSSDYDKAKHFKDAPEVYEAKLYYKTEFFVDDILSDIKHEMTSRINKAVEPDPELPTVVYIEPNESLINSEGPS